MLKAEKEVIIYSPFISKYRADFFKKTLLKLKQNNIHVFIFTRPIREHEEYMQEEIRSAIQDYKELGAHVTYIEGSIHEKVAIIDRKILWEGSLNILSQKSSKELMVRMEDEDIAGQILANLDLNQKLIKGYRLKSQPHDLKLDFGQRIKILLIKPALLTIKWSLKAVFQVIVLLLKGILTVFSIVEVIVG
jgi:phosphatidylserine/phosphatidylglycerophosphate/cardiolipin synthase-like enzyme